MLHPCEAGAALGSDQHDHVFARLQRIGERDDLFAALRVDGVGDRQEVLLVAVALGDLIVA